MMIIFIIFYFLIHPRAHPHINILKPRVNSGSLCRDYRWVHWMIEFLNNLILGLDIESVWLKLGSVPWSVESQSTLGCPWIQEYSQFKPFGDLKWLWQKSWHKIYSNKLFASLQTLWNNNKLKNFYPWLFILF